jgi:hypothetical protein
MWMDCSELMALADHRGHGLELEILLYTGFGQGREEKTIAGDDNKTVC